MRLRQIAGHRFGCCGVGVELSSFGHLGGIGSPDDRNAATHDEPIWGSGGWRRHLRSRKLWRGSAYVAPRVSTDGEKGANATRQCTAEGRRIIERQKLEDAE
jgi:hypothetical protein